MLERERNLEHSGGILCDEMGLGKTIQMFSLILNSPAGGNTLVICPKSVVHQWEQESFRIGVPVTVTTYHQVEKLMGTRWTRIILDEAHEVRNAKSKTHRRIKTLKYTYAWMVTGTPVYNSISDFAALASFIGYTRMDIQRYDEQIRRDIVLRRTKDDMQEFRLPKCHIETVDVPMEPEEQDLYANLYAGFCGKAELITSRDTMELLEMFLRLRQFMILPSMVPGVEFEGTFSKMARLFELLGTHPDEKALVFTQFHAESDFIQARAKRNGWPVCRIDGSVDEEARVHQIEKFKKGSGRSVFIIQIKAGGQGLNLQEATRVYIMGPSWSPATELQAISRAHRTGQTKEVRVVRLVSVCTGVPSIEESIQELQNHKMVVTSEVLSDPRLVPIGRRMTAVELKKFFV